MTPKKKSPKLQESYSTDEVKRYLGSLSEDFQGKVSAIVEQVGGLLVEMRQVRDTQVEHTTFHKQTKTILGSHTEMIGNLLLDVRDIKNEKIGRTDFSKLEKRVLHIENRLPGVRGT